ncbi:MAG: hypothetical protein JJLCMIEE_02836 [Acidimicrobiales bacterium]|nr:MAG: beta-phosphoglucomutase family hydrolase [Actinomycetota bacterium]MBV6509738.1 hypothetical protein [Acidimicrobiales bacterium]RIK04868.1 MAG: hypothetical protein DCC48_12580 [Acidobacteriota bacterium]
MADDVDTVPALVDSDSFDAVLFELDGVVTDTADVHAAAWKRTMDDYLESRAKERGEIFTPFDEVEDYLAHVDGKPRYDGVRDFLASRNIILPEGTMDSPPTEESVRGLGNRKNQLVRAVLRTEGVRAFDGTVEWIHRLRREGLMTAIVSSSRDTMFVLEVAGLTDQFDAKVDGLIRAERNLPGKPAPDTYLDTAGHLGVKPQRAVVVEDSIPGVEAARAGGFGLVIGVARHGNEQPLIDSGADIVLHDLSEMIR